MIDFSTHVGATVNISASLGETRHDYQSAVITGETPNLVMVKVDGEIEGVLKRTIVNIDVLKPASPKAQKAPKAPKAPKALKNQKGPSKKEQVIAMREANPSLSRKHAISMMVEVLGMTKAGASTYYQSVWKAS